MSILYLWIIQHTSHMGVTIIVGKMYKYINIVGENTVIYKKIDEFCIVL